VHDHRAGLARHFHALARQLVEAAARVVEGRVHRRRLLDPAHEGTRRRRDRLGIECGHGRLREHVAAQVLRVGADPEAHDRAVLLVVIGEVAHELRRLAEQDRQDAGRVGIERARVADAAHAQAAPHQPDDVERRDARGLVDYEDS
jgi:hypothetical protein